jgi:hypothetical protein
MLLRDPDRLIVIAAGGGASDETIAEVARVPVSRVREALNTNGAARRPDVPGIGSPEAAAHPSLSPMYAPSSGRKAGSFKKGASTGPWRVGIADLY